MLILHGSWFPGRGERKGKFGFWAETILSAATQKKTEILTHGRDKIPEHPYQAADQDVFSILSLFGSTDEILTQPDAARQPEKQAQLILSEPPTIRWREVLLPTSNGFPESSYDGFADTFIDSNSVGERNLLPWKIRQVEITASDAFIWLAKLPHQNLSSQTGIMLGADIQFWSATAKFALELLARERFLPSIVGEDELSARWIPVVNKSGDIERLETLVDSMPPVCRGEPSIRTTPPREIIIDFLNSVVDETVRRWFAEHLFQNTSWKERLLGSENIISIWLNGLSSTTATKLKCTPHQLTTLRDSIFNWSASIQIKGREVPWRTCFRLEEPQEELADEEKQFTSADWYLSFHLQHIDDKSLMLPANELWKKDASTTRFIKRKFGHPEERFLQDIARAAKLFPHIEQSLKKGLPTGCTLNVQQAHAFLKEGAWLLEECGYGVLVPSWWAYKKQTAQLGLKLKIKSSDSKPSSGAGFFTLNSIVDFKWDVAIGDENLSVSEFQKIAELKTPLVKVRGKWVEIDRNQIEAAMNFLNRIEKNGLTFSEALQIGLGQKNVGLPVVDFDPEGWLADFIKGGEQGKFEELTTPVNFKGKLRPYQIRGFSWLAYLRDRGLGACLADDMGLGKTIEFIALLLKDQEAMEKEVEQQREKARVPSPVLLICPTSVVGNWKHELERFSPTLNVMIHHGSERYSGERFVTEAKRHDLIVTTYSLAYRDEEYLKKIKWRGIALDEAQNIKNPWTKQSQAIRRLEGGYRIALTGTPVENRLTELWSIMEFLNPGYLGWQKEFKEQFAIPIERYGDKERAEILRDLIRPFVLRRVKTDKSIIQDLPEKIEIKVYCTLTQEQATLYQAVVNDMMNAIESSEGIKRRGLVLSTIMKLKQICNHPALFLQDGSAIENRSGKLTRFMEMIEEMLAEGDRALVFTQFVTMGEMLQNALQSTFGQEVLFLHGGVQRNARDKMIARFQNPTGGPPIFILSVKAGGFGLNLTAANHVFHFDRWWNPAVENQATDRAFRIGQLKNVQVRKFVCLGTLEERIDQLLEHKKGLSESIIGTGESWLTELSNEQLRDIFTLRKEVII